MTDAEAEAKVLSDYRKVAGRLIRVSYLSGYRDDDQVERYFDPPILVRVCRDQDVQPEHGLFHWNSEWLDPYWDVDVIPGQDATMEQISSCWTDGISYNIETGETEGQYVDVGENRLRRWLRWFWVDIQTAWQRWWSRRRKKLLRAA